MAEMSPGSRAILHQAITDAHLADRTGIDTSQLLHLDGMSEEDAAPAIDDVYGQIHFD
ncbi:hypothetical protein [Streptosporangium sp. NPDC051022]|uniref:hypothetical protein n=1 Tax=Streptosporangium sp. NPDC051022 TaxID=3155752 RepID=UPI003445B969